MSSRGQKLEGKAPVGAGAVESRLEACASCELFITKGVLTELRQVSVNGRPLVWSPGVKSAHQRRLNPNRLAAPQNGSNELQMCTICSDLDPVCIRVAWIFTFSNVLTTFVRILTCWYTVDLCDAVHILTHANIQSISRKH